jgi:hypothetical protein
MLQTRLSLLVAPALAAGLLGVSTRADAQQVVQPVPPPQYQPAPPQYQQAPPQYQQAPVYAPPPYGQPVYQQPQPMYQQPVYQQPVYVQPPMQQSMGPRIIKDWDPNTPIPPGYHVEEHARKGLIVGGAVLFGTTYLLSAISAAAVSDSNAATTANALYIPAVGPFIQMGQSTSATEGLFLALDGLCQVGGIAMFIGGLAAPNKELVRNDFGGLHLHLAPIVGKDKQGMGLVGTF